MRAICKSAWALVLLVAVMAALGQDLHAQSMPAPMDVLIGNITANDTQAAANDKFAELLTKYSNGRLSASARHGESLGTSTQMVAALQMGSVHGMIFPAGFMSTTVPELSLFDLPFLLPGEPAQITAFAAQSKAAARMMKLYEVAKFYTITEHSAFVSNIIVSKKWFDALSKDLQEAVERAGADTILWANDAYSATQNSSLAELRKTITVTNLPAPELQKMKDRTRNGIWERLKNDGQRGPTVKLLEVDLAHLNRM